MTSSSPFTSEPLRETGDPNAVITFRQWWWLPTGWVALGFLFSIQPWLAGFMGFSENVRFAALRLLPWAIVGPAAVWLCLRLPIAGPRWPRALLIHVAASIVAVLCLELPASFIDVPRARGHFLFQNDGQGGRPRRVFFGSESGGGAPTAPESGASAASAAPAIASPPANTPPPAPAGDVGVNIDAEPKPGAFVAAGTSVDRARWRAMRSPPPWFLRGRQSFPLYCCLVAFAHVLYLQRAARRAAQAEAQLTAARLAALQLQLQPHFLFNSLNAISSLVRTDAEAADEMICSLGALLHASLDKSGRAEVSLNEEMQMVQHYLRIQQVRFGEALRIETRIDTGASLAAIPTLSLQPLVENAIIHGLHGRAGTLRIGAWRREERLIVEIMDESTAPRAADPAPRQPTTGVGLKNIRSRLATLYGRGATLDLIRTSSGATARLELPFRQIAPP